MKRSLAAVLIAVLTLLASATQASATAAVHQSPASTLAALWKVLLGTPTPQNPFSGVNTCVHVAGVVTAFGTPPADGFRCTVDYGTPIFVVAWTSECSNREAAPFFGATRTAQRACARAADAGYTTHSITVDGRPAPVTEVTTEQIRVRLPTDNVLGSTATTVTSASHGWVTQLCGLSPGTHTVQIVLAGTDVFGQPVDATSSTVFIVKKRR